jgi:hypothetical protein
MLLLVSCFIRRWPDGQQVAEVHGQAEDLGVFV